MKAGATKDGKLVALIDRAVRIWAGWGRADWRACPTSTRGERLPGIKSHVHTQPGQLSRHARTGPSADLVRDGVDRGRSRRQDRHGPDRVPQEEHAAIRRYHRQLDMGAKEIGLGAASENARRRRAVRPLQVAQARHGLRLRDMGRRGGPSECQVDVFIKPDGSIAVQVGTQDLGTGSRTYTRRSSRKSSACRSNAVETRIGSSKYGRRTPSGGSTTTASLAPAVKDAALQRQACSCSRKSLRALSAKPEDLVGRRRQDLRRTESRTKRSPGNRPARRLGASGHRRARRMEAPRCRATASTARSLPRWRWISRPGTCACSRWSACRTAACR